MVSHGITKIGIITGTTGFGAAGRTQLIDIAEEYKLEIVADETYSPADTDMTAQLTENKKCRCPGICQLVNCSGAVHCPPEYEAVEVGYSALPESWIR